MLAAEARALEGAGLRAVPVDAPHHGARRTAFLDAMPDTSTVEGYRRLLAIIREARDEIPARVDALLREGHQHVAIAGVSLGGYIALAAATIEPRLAAIVSILGSPDWTPPDQDAAPFADALRESPHRLHDTFAPRPVLLLNGGRDENVRPEGARALVAALRPRYEALGATSALVHREWDVPHFVPADVWKEMIATTTAFLVENAGAESV